MARETEYSGDKPFRIRRGRVDSLSLYEITDHELTILEDGSPSSLYLNFSLLLVTTATSFLISLLATSIESDRTHAVFVILVVVGYALGALLGIIWWRTRQSISAITARIRSRIPPDEQVELDESEGSYSTQEGISQGEGAAKKIKQANV